MQHHGPDLDSSPNTAEEDSRVSFGSIVTYVPMYKYNYCSPFIKKTLEARVISTNRFSWPVFPNAVMCTNLLLLEGIETPHVPDRFINHAGGPFRTRHLPSDALPLVARQY